MIKMKRTVALVVAVAGMVLAGSAAQAASTISIIWSSYTAGVGTHGTNTLISPAASSAVTATIFLTADAPAGVSGVAISFLFDNTELFALSMKENGGPAAKAPGMTNQFAPLSTTNTVINNGTGTITGFDSATLGPGCVAPCVLNLGSIKFHVLNASGLIGTETDVVAALVLGSDDVNDVFNVAVGSTTIFAGAEVVGPAVVPEPTTALLVIGGLLGLGYSGRRNIR